MPPLSVLIFVCLLVAVLGSGENHHETEDNSKVNRIDHAKGGGNFNGHTPGGWSNSWSSGSSSNSKGKPVSSGKGFLVGGTSGHSNSHTPGGWSSSWSNSNGGGSGSWGGQQGGQQSGGWQPGQQSGGWQPGQQSGDWQGKTWKDFVKETNNN